MRILRTPGCTYSEDKGLDLHAPRSWQELTQDQLWYVFFLLARFQPEEVKTYLLFRLTGMRVEKKVAGGAVCSIRNNGRGKRHLFRIATWQIQSLIHQFDYIDSYENMGVRLERIGDYRAVDVLLADVAFMDYLNMEVWYQKFLDSRDETFLDQIASILYRDSEGSQGDIHDDATARVATLYWFSFTKQRFSQLFPHFFKPAGGQSEPPTGNYYINMVNSQLRALTDGDVTKLQTVKETATLDALAELNEKARESEEFKRRYGDK